MEKEANKKIDVNDVEDYKVMAILAYIVFFIPLLAARDSKFAMYHANQGLILFLTALVINIAGSLIPIIGWFLVLTLGNLAILGLAILGIINASKGLMKPLPVIGKFKILNLKKGRG